MGATCRGAVGHNITPQSDIVDFKNGIKKEGQEAEVKQSDANQSEKYISHELSQESTDESKDKID